VLPDLESLRCFLEAARLLNFRAASRVVGLTPAALGQRIRKLEEQLDIRLFDRTTRKVVLTEAGLALVPEARRTIAAAHDCVQAARGDLGPAPMDIVLGTRHELGLSWIVPMLPVLEAKHPGLTFHLYFGSGRDLELQVRTRRVDIAVSSRRLNDPELDFAKLHSEGYLLVATPQALSAKPVHAVEDLEAHLLIALSDEMPLFRYWRDAPGARDDLKFTGLRRMGTIAAIRSRVLDGTGVAVLPEYLVRPDLAARRLVTVLPAIKPLQDTFRLIFRSDEPRVPLYRSVAASMRDIPLQ
jgi:DNA-binding transcriptional LysR family regulator